jgi:hypothetical protein
MGKKVKKRAKETSEWDFDAVFDSADQDNETAAPTKENAAADPEFQAYLAAKKSGGIGQISDPEPGSKKSKRLQKKKMSKAAQSVDFSTKGDTFDTEDTPSSAPLTTQFSQATFDTEDDSGRSKGKNRKSQKNAPVPNELKRGLSSSSVEDMENPMAELGSPKTRADLSGNSQHFVFKSKNAEQKQHMVESKDSQVVLVLTSLVLVGSVYCIAVATDIYACGEHESLSSYYIACSVSTACELAPKVNSTGFDQTLPALLFSCRSTCVWFQ